MPKIVRATGVDHKRRHLKRVDVRPNEGVDGFIYLNHFTEKVTVQIYDLSITGACLVLDSKYKEHLHPFGSYQIEVNIVSGSGAKGIYTCCWIEDFKKDKIRAGFKATVPARAEGHHPAPRNNDKMLDVPRNFPILGFFYKDHFYYERAAFLIQKISKKKMLISIFDTEVLIFSGGSISLQLSINASDGLKITGKVEHITPENSQLSVLLKIDTMAPVTEFNIVNHLLQNTDLSPEEIREAEFKVHEISNTFRFRYLKTKEEYEEVLNLRLQAYLQAGKLKEDVTRDQLIAPLDKISRILVAYHGKKMVASVALSFPDSEHEQLDTERALSGGYPPGMPKKTDLIEVARLCTHPNYRRGDLLLRMFEQMYKVFAFSDRNYILTSTDNKLWNIYKKLGFRKTGHTYLHPYLEGIEHSLIIVKRGAGTHSYKLNPLAWNYLYRNMTNHVLARRSIEYGVFGQIKMLVYRLIGYALRIRTKDRY